MGDESEELGDRQLKLSLEAELESLKRFRHVQPRIGTRIPLFDFSPLIKALGDHETRCEAST
jgi:hypothetical protein